MAAVSTKFEAGFVFLPKRAAWLADFEAELFAFPGSRHDDQCNSVSLALSDEMRKPGFAILESGFRPSRSPSQARTPRSRLGWG